VPHFHDAMPVTPLLLPTGGRPLPSALRRALEECLQANLSDVRILEGPHVRELGARAFTLGSELHFAPGEFSAATRRGLELLGHELAHVLQQRMGRVQATWGQVVHQDAGLEAEADALGRRVAERLAHGHWKQEETHALPSPRVLPWRPVPPGQVLQCQPEGLALSQASFLKGVAKTIFDNVKEDESKLMEVQATILGDTLYIAANYSAGTSQKGLAAYCPPEFDLWHKKNRLKLFRKVDIKFLEDTLHAEQQLLEKLTAAMKKGEDLSHMVVIGTKRPCSYCRRVLRAFNTSLGQHYPDLKLHFVDRTGLTLDNAVARLTLDPGNNSTTYKQFVRDYESEVSELIKPLHTLAKIDDETEEKNSVRANASPEISYMT
jgi:hypothetical protein